MEKLTCDQFKSLCESLSVRHYIYDTENQLEAENARMKLSLDFRNLFVANNPESICLKDTCNTLYIGNVKSVRVRRMKSAIGIVFDIIYNDCCGSKDRCVTLIAR